MKTHTKLLIALLAALLLAAGCGSDDADETPAVEYKVMGGRLVWCSGGAEDMVVPGNASSIGNNAFSNCGSIGTLTIPASVTYIMRYTFSGVRVGKIIFGGTVAEWADMAEQDGFGETLRGTSVICSDGEWKWTAPAVPVTPNDWQITDGVLVKYSGNAATVTIPDGVTAIAGGAFAGHTELEHISIPAGVTSIGENAFAGCTGLAHVDIPASVTDIGAGALPAGTAVTYHGTAEQWDELAKDGGLDGVTVQFTGESGTPAHTHTWGEAYTNGGEEGHYRTCTTEGCSEHSEIVLHECTYTENGDTHTKTCTANCGYSKTEAHTWGVEYTDNGDGTHSRACTGCGRTESAPHGYTYSDDSSTTHTMTCTECDYAKTEAHDYGGETYTDAGHVKKCTGCGHSETAQHIWGDTYENDGNGHYQICTTTGCNAHSATEEHTWSAYTDDHDGFNHSKTCSVCNRTEHAVHDWGAYADNGSGKHYQTCSVCHGQSKAVAHDYEYKDSADGTHTITCTKCEYANTEEHKYDNGTDNGNGTHTETCSACAATKTENHAYSDGTCAVCAFLKPKISNGTIDDNGVLVRYTGSEAASLTIPNGVTGIGSEWIANSTLKFTTLTIPVSVTNIASKAFKSMQVPFVIKYKGTMDQWNAITKESGYGLKGKTIKCADGDLTAE
ncbi:MAG: leucine-rich repeat domain-containing protein [Treponemataceae bacterium]|nr:leucine-rich repeat domain-containing protein [Treponemataceae bacterium]